MTELDAELMVQMHTLWLEYQDARDKIILKQKKDAKDKIVEGLNLSVKECSNYLRLSDKTIYRRILDGKIEATRVGSKYIIPKKQFL